MQDKTYDDYLKLVKEDANLSKVPYELRIKEICEASVSEYGVTLCFVPEHLRTENICKMAVSNYGISLSDVPEDIINEEICKLAVSNDGTALVYVPDKFKTEEICKIAVSNCEIALAYVPKELRTEDMCKEAIKHNNAFLIYVPELSNFLFSDSYFYFNNAKRMGELRISFDQYTIKFSGNDYYITSANDCNTKQLKLSDIALEDEEIFKKFNAIINAKEKYIDGAIDKSFDKGEISKEER